MENNIEAIYGPNCLEPASIHDMLQFSFAIDMALISYIVNIN